MLKDFLRWLESGIIAETIDSAIDGLSLSCVVAGTAVTIRKGRVSIGDYTLPFKLTDATRCLLFSRRMRKRQQEANAKRVQEILAEMMKSAGNVEVRQ
jgi:hypothetical protein